MAAAPERPPGPASQHAAPDAAPRVSVVVPTFRRPGLLAECLRALQAQTLDARDYEVVVVDDGHDDTTRTLVERLAAASAAPALRCVRPARPPGSGPAAARNAGWRAARGEIIAFTDDDTRPAADWLAQGDAALRAGDFAALAGRVVVPRTAAAAAPTDHERMTQGLERAEFVTANAFVRRVALQRIGGFDERFTRAWREDSDLQFRLLDDGGRVGRCDSAVVLHPVRSERWGVSLRQQKNACFEALLYAKHPRRYREQVGLPTPWDYHAIVALTLAALLFGAWRPGVAAAAAGAAALLVLRFAARRLQGTSHAPAHVAEMLLTSALIPFLSVYWRLRGALRYRAWFV